MKAQSAAEFLMTYGWALVIMLSVVAILYMLGVFNPSSSLPNSCVFPIGLSCSGYKIVSGGALTLQLGQNTGKGITITRLGCSASETPPITDLGTPVYIMNGGSEDLSTVGVHCTLTDGVSTPTEGDFYSGTIYVTYVDEDIGITHDLKGDIGYKVEFSHWGSNRPTARWRWRRELIVPLRPRRDSNPDYRLRRPASYPLDYEGFAK